MMKYIQPTSPDNAVGLVSDVYAQIKRDFGRIVEPFTLHSPVPTLLAGCWMVCRETELVGKVSRSKKEAIAATVSVLNRCSYCVDAHTVLLNSTGDHSTASAIGKAQYQKIINPTTRAIVEWTLATRSPNNEVLQSPPFSPEEAPEVVGTAVFYHYINRMATIFLGDTPLPSSNSRLKGPLKRIAGLMFSQSAHRLKTPGESLGFLLPAGLPEDFAWTETNPTVAQAFARFANAVRDIGEAVLDQEVRERITSAVDRWRGEEMTSRSWVEAETKKLKDQQKCAIQLGLLAALAPHQINEGDILNFEKSFPYVTSLLGTTAWASFAAARRIGTWISYF